MNENFTASIKQEDRSMEKEEFVLHDEKLDLDSTLKTHLLRWKNHMIFVMGNLTNFYEHDLYADCTVYAEGQSLRAHKVILAAVSPYFDCILKEEPHKNSFVLKDVQFQNLKSVLDFIYYGAVDVANDDLPSFLKLVELLQLKILFQPSHQQGIAELTVEKDSNHASCNENKNRSATVRQGTDDVPSTSLNETSLPVGPLSNRFKQFSDFGFNEKMIESNGDDEFAHDNVIFAQMNCASQIHKFPSQGISELRKIDCMDLPERRHTGESGLLPASESPSSVKVGKYIINFGDGNIDPFVKERAPVLNTFKFNFDNSLEREVQNRILPHNPEVPQLISSSNVNADFRRAFYNFKFHLDNTFERECQNKILQNHPQIPQFFSSNNVNATLNRDLIRDSGIPQGSSDLLCKICGKHFSSKSELLRHVYYFHKSSFSSRFQNKPHHFQNISNGNLRPHSNSGYPGTRIKKYFTCFICNSIAKTLDKLREHWVIHKIFHCEVCKNIFGSKKKFKQHLKTHNEFTCAECSKCFGNYSVLKEHVAVHHRSKTYTCAVCGKSFGVLSNLDQHYLCHAEVGKLTKAGKKKKKTKKNIKEKLYRCEKCNKKFVSPIAVKNHIDSKHQDTS